MSEKKHPLEGYWLVRGAKRDEECNPFRSVMDLESLDDAIRVGADDNKVTDDFAGYLDFRKEVENWAREGAIDKGINISNKNPVYFTLMHEPMLGTPPPGHITINIPAEQIPIEAFSLTYADSFDNYMKLQGKPSEWTPKSTACEVFNAEEVAQKLNTEGLPEDLKKYENSSYIEVQLWNRDLPALEEAKQQIRKSKAQVVTLQADNTLSQALAQFNNPNWQPSAETLELKASGAATQEEKNELAARRPDLFSQPERGEEKQL